MKKEEILIKFNNADEEEKRNILLSLLLDLDKKDDKYDRIAKMARRIAHEVQKTHQDATLDPMPADERRIVHNALTNMPNIKTESSGFGKNRQVNIIYVD